MIRQFLPSLPNKSDWFRLLSEPAVVRGDERHRGYLRLRRLRQLCRSLQGDLFADKGYGIADPGDDSGKLVFRDAEASPDRANLIGVRKVDHVSNGSNFFLAHLPISLSAR